MIPFSANDELALHVADPAAAESFYTGMLGCTVVSRTADCIALASGALRLYLLRDPAPTHDAVVPSFDVPDRASAIAQLQRAGCTLVPIGPHAPGEHYVRDPHGIIFDVVERHAPASMKPTESSTLWTVIPLLPAGPDLAEGLRFYTEQLGFDVTWQGSEMAGVRRGNAAFNLVRNGNREWAENASVSIGVDDLDALYREYQGVAAKVGPLEMKSWGRREFHMVLPSGVCLQFHQEPG